MGCTSSPIRPNTLDLLTEPYVQTETAVFFRNLSKTEQLVIGDIFLTPGMGPIRWTGPGPFELAPEEESEIYVRFSPEELGEWEETLTFETNAGPFSIPINLRAEVGFDGDGDRWSVAMGDCNDNDATVHPWAPESCNEVDDDCDSAIDEDFDNDGDGFFDATQCLTGLDCNDNDKTANPSITEECDQTDSDCNGVIDDLADLADLQNGVCQGMTKVCPKFGAAREPEYTDQPLYERVEYTCDGYDNDCNGSVDDFDHLGDGTPDCIDNDGDGQSEVDGDCDDTDASITRENCGAPQLGVTSLSSGFHLINLNTWKNEAFTIADGTYQGASASNGKLYFATRIFKDVQEVTFDPYTTRKVAEYVYETMAVIPSPDNAELYVLLKNGVLETHSLLDGTARSLTLSGNLRAMTLDGDQLWICSSDGYVHRVDTQTLGSSTKVVGTECYGPPVVDLKRQQVVVSGYEDYQLTAISRSDLSVLNTIETSRRVLRGTVVNDTIWFTTGVDKSIRVHDATTLTFIREEQLGTPVQGIWYDTYRHTIWAALFDANQVVGLDPDTFEERALIPVTEPVNLFPLQP